jgi:hypothetical protein
VSDLREFSQQFKRVRLWETKEQIIREWKAFTKAAKNVQYLPKVVSFPRADILYFRTREGAADG